MRIRSKKRLIIILAIIAIIAGIFITFLYYGKSDTLNLTINQVTLSQIQNGTYQGSYSKGRFSYKVEVTVNDHKIENVKILRSYNPSLEETLVSRVLQKQSPKVDTVTGATASSNALLKAIENALGNNP
jgi:uncharacterized protein with FMN-binding domain